MPRELCGFCRRERAERKRAPLWYNTEQKYCAFCRRIRKPRQRTNGNATDALYYDRIYRGQKAAKNHINDKETTIAASSAAAITSRQQSNSKIDPASGGLLDSFGNEAEIEQVLTPKNETSIVPESINSCESMVNTMQQPDFKCTDGGKIINDAITISECGIMRKRNLAHFKIAESTLRQCADLLRSLPTNTPEGME